MIACKQKFAISHCHHLGEAGFKTLENRSSQSERVSVRNGFIGLMVGYELFIFLGGAVALS
jgi:hypothetical protein